ncbi:MAG: 23S rRNA (adenine(2503)-C(2))-methyltransferase RlmN [Dethiobacter sp.]|jgi:23S rRNA (adenine2503-C2)-methyltransferase|nr:23S rRNA (adenine(2503)-C(2))-methyltransferase RlmN [Dethiobacter sp.]
MKTTIALALTPAAMAGFLEGLGEPPYRADQVLDWLYRKQAYNFSDMTNLPQGLREKLQKEAKTGFLELVKQQVSDDGTIKLLFALGDGESVETVALPYRTGHSVCVSTQVGCKMGCLFCASGMPGFVRNLTAAEIMAQVLQVKKLLAAEGHALKSMVLMGTGEPLDNWAALLPFLNAVHDPARLGMSLRHVTISTSGVAPRILDLAKLGWPLTLSVSLHAPNDKLRGKIMPVNRKYPLSVLLPACWEFAEITGRRVTFEYLLIDSLNDGENQARELSGLLRGMQCHVNLIPLNAVPELPFTPSKDAAVLRFQEILRQNKINVTVRRKLGADIAAACGQLRNTFRGSEQDGCRRDKRQGKSQGKK